MSSYKDLLSIQEVRGLLEKASEAVQEFRAFDQKRVDNIVKAMVDAGYKEAERLGKLAYEETGFAYHGSGLGGLRFAGPGPQR